MSTLNARLADPGYKLWVKATLCLHYAKDGLEKFVEDKSRELHDTVLKEVQKLDNMSIEGLCPDSELEFNRVGKNWTVKDCSCQECARCIAVIENRVVKNGQIFLDPNVQELHDKVLQELSNCGNPSVNGICAGGNLRFNRKQNKWELMNCHCNRCQMFVDTISKYRCATLGRTQTTTFTFKQNNFNNSDIQQWHTEHWQLAKLFMNPGQGVTTISPPDTDISGLLNFIYHCDGPRADLQNTQNIEKVREGRNTIIHTCTMRLTEAEFLSKTQDMIDLLSDPKCVVQYKESQDATDMIRKVRSSDFTITLENEAECLQVLAAEVKKSSEIMKNDIARLTTRLESSEQTTLEEITHLRADIKRQEEWAIQVISRLRNKIKDNQYLLDILKLKVSLVNSLLKENRCQMQSMAGRLDRLECQQKQMESRQGLFDGRQVEIEARQYMVEGRLDDLDANVQQFQAPLPPVTEEDKAKLQTYVRDGYDYNKLAVPVLFACHGLPVTQIFAPVILTRDTESFGQEEGSGIIWDSRSYKAFITEDKRYSAPVQRTVENENLSSYKSLFFKQNVLQKKIFLLGKAGAGKSTLCKHLTGIWCNDKVSPQFDDADVLKLFRYLFHVSCRFAEASESIFDMICNQLFCKNDEMIKFAAHVLKNTPDECLVIVDGIDEWKGSAKKATGRRGDVPGLPSRKGLEDCVVLSTSRPERIHMLPTKLDKTCSVFELQGIREIPLLISHILRKAEYPDPQHSCSEFLSQINRSNLADVIQLPLMLINALSIWDMKKELSDSKSVNYSNMMEGLFLHAKEADRIEEHVQERNLEMSAEKLPDCFLDANLCKRNAGLIIGLGNLAFDLLFNDEQDPCLIFSEQKSKDYLTEIQLNRSLAVGILSKAQMTSRSSRRIDSFSFCHKTFQEFLGALWLSIEQSEPMSMFLRHFGSTDALFDNEVFLHLLCGLSHSAGDKFWQYIAKEVIEKDKEAIKFRMENDFDHRLRHKAKVLQDLVLQCIKEAMNSDLKQRRRLYYLIPDIHVSRFTDEWDITLLNGLVEKYVCDIKSVTLYSKLPSGIVKSMKKMQSAISIRLDKCDCDRLAMPVLQFPHQLKLLSMTHVDITSEIEFPRDLTSLTARHIKLSHSGVEQMSSCLSVSSNLRYLHLDSLLCNTHGASRCLQALDLQGLPSLERVTLCEVSAQRVLLPGQGSIFSPLNALTIKDIKLSHSGIEHLWSYVSVSSYLQDLHLVDLFCSDHGDSCCLPALDLQKLQSLEEVRLQELSLDRVLLPGQGTIPSQLTLTVSHSKLSHSGIEELCSRLCVSSNLQHLCLGWLYCSEHGDSCHLPALDLQRHNSLKKVSLLQLSIESVLLPGHSLKRVKLENVSDDSVLLPGQRERHPASSLNAIPTFYIEMDGVHMSFQGWRRWLNSFPHLSNKLKVVLWSCNIDKDLKSYIRSCSHFKVTRDDNDRFHFKTKQDQ